jgi:hypothetical protein
MRLPDSIAGRLRLSRSLLGVGADAVTLITFVILVAPAIVGFVLGSTYVWLAGVILGSILTNAYLLVRLRRFTPRYEIVSAQPQPPGATVIPRNTSPAKGGADPSDHPRDLANYLLSIATFELALASASEVAKAEVGPGGELVFSSVLLSAVHTGLVRGVIGEVQTFDRTIFFDYFHADSGSKAHIGIVEGRAPTVSAERSRSPISVPAPVEPPWRLTPGWEDLVRRAWTRVKPFKGWAWLSAAYPLEGGLPYWWVQFQRAEGSVSEEPLAFVISDGKLMQTQSGYSPYV